MTVVREGTPTGSTPASGGAGRPDERRRRFTDRSDGQRFEFVVADEGRRRLTAARSTASAEGARSELTAQRMVRWLAALGCGCRREFRAAP
jgi:hypothetical protein